MENRFFTQAENDVLAGILNEYQIESINNALAEEADHELLYNVKTAIGIHSGEELKKILIDKVVVPYNVKRIGAKTKNLIDEGKWMIQCVGGGDGQPPFAYTVGMQHINGFELFASGITPTVLGGFLNAVGGYLKENPNVLPEDLTERELGLFDITGGHNGRYRLMDVSNTSVYSDHMYACKEHVGGKRPKVYALVLPDKDNRLPDEEGYDGSFIQIHVKKD